MQEGAAPDSPPGPRAQCAAKPAVSGKRLSAWVCTPLGRGAQGPCCLQPPASTRRQALRWGLGPLAEWLVWRVCFVAPGSRVLCPPLPPPDRSGVVCATVPSTASEAAFWSPGVIVVHMRIRQSPKGTVRCRPLEWSRNPGPLARLRGSQHWRHRGRRNQPGSVCDGRSGGPSTEASIRPHTAFSVPLVPAARGLSSDRSEGQLGPNPFSRLSFYLLFCPLPERHLAGRRSPEWRLSLRTRARHLPRWGRRSPRRHSSRLASATSRSPVSCSFSTTGPGIRCCHFPCWGPGGPATAVCRLVPAPEGAHGRLARVPRPAPAFTPVVRPTLGRLSSVANSTL